MKKFHKKMSLVSQFLQNMNCSWNVFVLLKGLAKGNEFISAVGI